MEVAVLGLGEAGSRIAADLVAAGCTVRGWDPLRRPAGIAERGERSRGGRRRGRRAEHRRPRRSPSMRRASVAGALDTDAIYADLNTSAPQLKRELGGDAPGAVRRRRPDRRRAEPRPRNPALASGAGAERFARAVPPARHAGRGRRRAARRRRGPEASAQRLHEGRRSRGDRGARGRPRGGRRGSRPRETSRAYRRALLERLLSGSRVHAARRVDEMQAAAAYARGARESSRASPPLQPNGWPS